MSATIHFSGPGIDRRITLTEGAAELTVGRDPACDVHLPDPEKAISRKHLAIRLQGGLIEYRVVSSINGVLASTGEVQAGATGILPAGEQLGVGSYTLLALTSAEAAEADSDDALLGASPIPGPGPGPGLPPKSTPLPTPKPLSASDAQFDDWLAPIAPNPTPVVPVDPVIPAEPVPDFNVPLQPYAVATPAQAPQVPPALQALQAQHALHAPPLSLSDDPFASLDQAFGDDPFSEWTSNFNIASPPSMPTLPAVVPSAPPSAPAVAAPSPAPSPTPSPSASPSQAAAATPRGASPADSGLLEALFSGLGLTVPKGLDSAGAQHIGAVMRLIVEGFADLLAARAALKRELRAEDRTMLNARGNNPLKLGLSTDELLQYLFAANAAGAANAAYMAPQRALKETVTELRAHEIATIAASRAAVQGAIDDFEPVKLKAKLTKDKTKLPQFLDHARLWDLYEQHYEEQQEHMTDWLDKLFDRHFMPVYSKESERLRMNIEAGEPPNTAPST